MPVLQALYSSHLFGVCCLTYFLGPILRSGARSDRLAHRRVIPYLQRIYEHGRSQLNDHHRRNARGRPHVAELWSGTRTPQQQNAYRQRTQR